MALFFALNKNHDTGL